MMMQSLCIASLLLLLVACSSSTQQVQYVRPNESSAPQDCPHQPCLTFDQYAQQADTYFIAGTTFYFMAGNHILQTTLYLKGIVALTLRLFDTDANIIYRNKGTILCENVTNINIEGLTFISVNDIYSAPQNPSFLTFLNSEAISVLNTTFRGHGDLTGAMVRALFATNSTIIIVSCLFEGCTGDNGGAIYADKGSNITLVSNAFTGNKAVTSGGAIFSQDSLITMKEALKINSNCPATVPPEVATPPCATIFSFNEAGLHGGAIFWHSSAASMGGTSIVFRNNSASQGGAVFCNNSTVYFKTKHLHFYGNVAHDTGGALNLKYSSLSIGEEVASIELQFLADYTKVSLTRYYQNINITIQKNCTITDNSSSEHSDPINTTFSNNQAQNGGGAIYANAESSVSLSGTNMWFTRNSARQGGALYMRRVYYTKSTTRNLYFTGNTASDCGGAIVMVSGSLILGEAMNTNHHFSGNSCGTSGGAIYHEQGLLAIMGNTCFSENHAYLAGGAISKSMGLLLVSCRALFTSNYAKFGGAIALFNTGAQLNGTVIDFRNNSAYNSVDGVCYVKGRTCIGGAIASSQSQIIAYEEVNFVGNSAVNVGGAISSRFGSEVILISANFYHNRAEAGGALQVEKVGRLMLHNVTVTGNSGSAINIRESASSISGVTLINQNVGERGAAIYAANCVVSVTGHTSILDNRAGVGGAIIGFNSAKFLFSSHTLLANNTADLKGGAIYAVDANITFNNTVQFISNTAQNGGAMFFESETTLTIEENTVLLTRSNHASDYGGVLYHEDSGVTTRQCIYPRRNEVNRDFFLSLPHCFLILKGITTRNTPVYLESYNDSAGKDGSYIYGGLLDKCQVYALDSNTNQTGSVTASAVLNTVLHITPLHNDTAGVTSQPYQLCFCSNEQQHNCYDNYEVDAYRGQRFQVPLAQNDIVTSTTVTVRTNPTARLNLNQNLQTLHRNCTDTTYNVYSTEDGEELVLYPDGPCSDRGHAKLVINVTILPCPDGFEQSNEKCVCEERLQVYGPECIIDDDIHITRTSNFWMSTLYVNGSYQGLILYKTCPAEYCRTGNISLHLDNLDAQCDLNHTGVLCGACAANYSLMLGSSRCQVCSNLYIAMLVPFAFAGIALVIFLTFLRLTVAIGTINSIIFYANVVQANRKLFFPNTATDPLTVFIAWLNLDLGFQTCFYHGMDAYAQTWLQFAFPLYVWVLIGLIILTSRYSITVSKMIGHNPIAVLATLLLMSYAKILKIIIEVYSYVHLDYPHTKRVTVWLKDANVPYLQSWHLLLTVMTSLILLAFFLPYTLLLLLGHKLYRCTGRRHLHWIKPLLDSYYAPYKRHTCYWPGFLLVVRCALYIVFSFNSLGATNRSLLAIIITLTAMGIAASFIKLYTHTIITVMEVLTYFNLIVLSAVSLAGIDSPSLVYVLIGLVFVTLKAVCVYQFHFIYFSKSTVWLWIKAKLSLLERIWTAGTPRATPGALQDMAANPPAQGVVTHTVVEVREPLLQ